MKANDIVKYSKPSNGEESFRFVLIHVDNGKADIRLICDMRIKPVETVAVGEIEAEWSVEDTGGGCQWLRNGMLAITNGEAGLPQIGESCELITLNKDGNSDGLVPPKAFPSLECCLAETKMLKRIYGRMTND